MSTQPNVKQFKPGTAGQVVTTTAGGAVAWGNPLATTAALGDVQLATQSQAWAGTPDTSGSNPLVMQPSGTLIRRNQTAGHAELYTVAVTDQNSFTVSTTNARGILALDLQSQIVTSTEVASGNFAVAIGSRNTAVGISSTCIGRFNTCNSYQSIAAGYGNTVSSFSSNNHAFGGSNSIGTGCVNTLAIGTSNTIAASGQGNTALGSQNTINSSNSQNTIVGFGNTSGVNAFRAGIFGFNNSGLGSGSFILGQSNIGNGTDFAFLFGVSNSAPTGGSVNTAIGSGNAIQSINHSATNNSVLGVNNVLNSIQLSTVAGVSNNLQGTIGETDWMAFGNTNSIATGGSINGCFGYGNGIGAGSSRSWAFGESNSVTSIAYGNGGGIAAAFGISNSIQNGEHVYLFGYGNRSLATNNTVFADYNIQCGISNTANVAAHSAALFGLSNFISGTFSTAVGINNTTGTGTSVQMFGRGNTVSAANGTTVAALGNNNTVGNGSIAGDNTVIIGNSNHCLSGCNVFGQNNFVSANIFGTGNATNTNCFGSSNSAGSYITNSDIFGSNNAVGTTLSFGFANPDSCVSLGRNNSTVQNNTLQVGTNNIQNQTTLLATESIHNLFFGQNNTCGSYSSYNTLLGYGNSWQLYANKALAVGYKNIVSHNQGGFGAYSNTANLATAVGHQNTAACDNTVAVGLGNFAGPSSTGTSVSSIAIGILNNNDRSQAFIDNTTGALTLNGFNLPVKNPGGGSIGTNSIAVGSENITSGLNSIAFGRHNDANGTESVALGVRCQAQGAGATALGNRAIARVANTFNVGGLPIVRRDAGEAAGTEFYSYSGMPAIIQSKVIDLTISQQVLIQLPVGPRFFIDELGIEVVSGSGFVTSAPYCSWGTQIDDGTGPVTNQKYRTIGAMTSLQESGTRETFTTFEADDGETSDNVNTVWLLARIDIGGVAYAPWTGRFYWKGRYVDQ